MRREFNKEFTGNAHGEFNRKCTGNALNSRKFARKFTESTSENLHK